MSSIEGMDALQANLKELERSVGKEIKDAYVAGGKLVEGDAKKSIAKKSSGNLVTRWRKGKGTYEHVASAPGDAPNTDTGTLIRSINTEIEKDGVYVGTTVDYGKHLEFGTNKMDERPWLMPALDGRKDDIRRLYVDALDQSIKKAAKVV